MGGDEWEQGGKGGHHAVKTLLWLPVLKFRQRARSSRRFSKRIEKQLPEK